jgi:HEAT repeat protein
VARCVPDDDARRLITWEAWWDHNDERFLDRRRVGSRALGGTTPGLGNEVDGVALAARLREQTRQDALPMLLVALTDASAPVRAAAAIALGRAADSEDVGAYEALVKALGDPDGDVRSAACIALGLTGSEAAIERLLAVARDDASGRSLVGRQYVLPLTRSHAAVALGLIGYRHGLPNDVQSELLAMAYGNGADQELQVGATTALQLLSRQDAVPGLMAMATDDRFDDVVRSHAAVGLAKLGARTAIAPLRNLVSDASPLVSYSSIIALGLLADADDKESVAFLRNRATKGGDGASRSLSLMALAEVGGASARAAILEALSKAKLADERAFAALAAGVTAALHPEDLQYLQAALAKAFRVERNISVRCALALSMGLSRCGDALDDLHRALADTAEPQLQGYAAVALGLLGDQQASEALRILVAQRRDPVLRERASLALGLLKDPQGSTAVARAAMDSKSSMAFLSATLRGLGYAGDGASVEFLREFVENRKRNHADLTRLAAVRAMGLLADKDHVPLLSRLQESSNYMAQTELLARLFAID